jgi:cyclase
VSGGAAAQATAAEASLHEVADRVFAYVQPDGSWFVSNTGLITGADGVLSIDTCATEARTRAYLAAIATVTSQPVTMLVNTHHHGDHTNGNRVLNAPVIIAQTSCRALLAESAGPPPAAVFGPVDWGDIRPGLPTACFDHSLQLHVGERPIELLHFGTAAHTTNDVVAWLPDDRVLFAGDLVFNGGTPFALQGSLTGWLEVLPMLAHLQPEIIVPGHGPPGGPELLKETARYLAFVQQEATLAHAARLTPLAAAAEIDLGEFAALSDSERLIGNLHRALAELRGLPRGAPLDVAACFADMMAYNGGGPLRCLA